MAIYRTYGIYMADVFSDAIRLFFLLSVYFTLGSDGWVNRLCPFQLRDGGSGAGRGGSMAFYGGGRSDDLFTAYGGDCQPVEDVCFIDTRHDDVVVYCGRCVVFVIFANI